MLLALLVLAALAFYWFVDAFLAADKAVQVSIIAATASLAAVLVTYLKERSKAIKEAHRDRKIEVYSIFYDIVFDLLRDQKDGIVVDLENDKSFRDRWFALTRGIIFYGSPGVVQAMANFKTNELGSPGSVMQRIGDLYLAMRKDIGLSNWGLDNMSIHQIYVNDDVNKIFDSGART